MVGDIGETTIFYIDYAMFYIKKYMAVTLSLSIYFFINLLTYKHYHYF